METNTIVGLIGAVCISFSLLFIFAIGLFTVIKKGRQMYQSGTENYITVSQAKDITDGQHALNDKLNKLKSAKAN